MAGQQSVACRRSPRGHARIGRRCQTSCRILRGEDCAPPFSTSSALCAATCEQLALSILSAQPFEGEVQRKDAPAAATRTWISSAAARRFSNRCAAFLRSSALSAIFRLQKHWMLTAALCSTCFWRLIASTVAFAALRRDAAWILGATERVSLTVCTKATEEH